MRVTKVATSYREKPLSPKHGTASPYPMILPWNICLDIRIKILERRLVYHVLRMYSSEDNPKIRQFPSPPCYPFFFLNLEETKCASRTQTLDVFSLRSWRMYQYSWLESFEGKISQGRIFGL
jgi:hypothetical protein